MGVDISKLRGFIDKPQIQEWIRDKLSIDIDSSHSTHNLIELYNNIIASGHEDEFIGILRNICPEIIKYDGLPDYFEHIVPEHRDQNKIFSSYNPTLLRYPMQIIFKCDDSQKLKSIVELFTGNLDVHENLFIDDFAYIEYVPQNLMEYIEDIPHSNWELYNV